MEEENEKHLREHDEVVKDVTSELDDKNNASNDDSDKDQQQKDLEAEKGVTDSIAIEQSSMIKMESQPDDKEGKSTKNREKNQQQTIMKSEKEEYQCVPLSNMEESTTSKRIRESDEIELNIKKMKSETYNANTCEPNYNSHEIRVKYDEKIKEDEEEKILELFTNILDTIIARKNVEETDIINSIKEIKKSFTPIKTESGNNITFQETNFTQWENICAYLYRFGSHGAGFARYTILNAIRNCKEVENILKKPDLKIISLGSGPGNDAVGLCSALSKLQYPKSLKLTLVDKYEEWYECIELAESFIKSQILGKVSELFQRTIVDFQFIRVDLPGNLKSDKKYFKLLGEADVIVASKFFTSLDRANDGKFEKAIIKSLHKHMKEDAVILVNDILKKRMWSRFRRAYKWPDVEEYYKYYESSAKAEDRFESSDDAVSKLPIQVFVKKSAKT